MLPKMSKKKAEQMTTKKTLSNVGDDKHFRFSLKSAVVWRKDKAAGKTCIVTSLRSKNTYYKPNKTTVYV